MVSRSKLKKKNNKQQNKAKHKKAVKVGSCESNVESPQEAKPWRMSGTCLMLQTHYYGFITLWIILLHFLFFLLFFQF